MLSCLFPAIIICLILFCLSTMIIIALIIFEICKYILLVMPCIIITVICIILTAPTCCCFGLGGILWIIEILCAVIIILCESVLTLMITCSFISCIVSVEMIFVSILICCTLVIETILIVFTLLFNTNNCVFIILILTILPLVLIFPLANYRSSKFPVVVRG